MGCSIIKTTTWKCSYYCQLSTGSVQVAALHVWAVFQLLFCVSLQWNANNISLRRDYIFAVSLWNLHSLPLLHTLARWPGYNPARRLCLHTVTGADRWGSYAVPPLFSVGGQHRNCAPHPHFSAQKNCEAYSLTHHSSLLKAATQD